MEFSEVIKKARLQKGITQQELADKIFVTRQTISKWELGKSVPDQLSLKLLFRELNISPVEKKTSLKDLIGSKELLWGILVFILSPAVLLVRFIFYQFERMGNKRLALLVKCTGTLLFILYLRTLNDDLFYLLLAIVFFAYLLYQLYLIKLEN